MPSLAEAQDRTMRAILDRNTRQGHHLFVLLLALAALLAVLAVAVMLLIRRTRSLKRSRRSLHETNEKLSQHVQRLKSTGEELHATNLKLEASNEKLAEKYDDAVQNASDLVTSNSDKEKCIADIFALCSDYITKIEDFRTRIFRLMIAGKYDEARDIAKSGELSSRELKDLYANFDRLFLRIYPDFVSDLNTLLKPDSQIEQKQQGVLNTELRICALMRLGVSDSSKIAKFLHVSVQTVYNTSQRLRNKALIPRENFAETVRSLGQISL